MLHPRPIQVGDPSCSWPSAHHCICKNLQNWMLGPSWSTHQCLAYIYTIIISLISPYLIHSKYKPSLSFWGDNSSFPQKPCSSKKQLQQGVSSSSCRNSNQIPAHQHKTTNFKQLRSFKSNFWSSLCPETIN